MSPDAKRAVAKLQRAAASVIRPLLSAGLIALVLAGFGVAALVMGVRIVFGEGWAYIAAAVPLLFAALVLARGAMNG